MRIAHIADIHIRGLQRHDEYRHVFTQFVKDASEQHVDVIFVGGDIFHTKTSGISPEYIDFMRWWLAALASVAPVHLILGNHDGNLTNIARQDAVSPIVDALANPKIHLYKQSGVYEFAPGWNWCVYSLFDKEGWEKVRPVPGAVNIACYHGPVRSSVTETGWAIEDGPSVDFFEEYDLVLLGDIHRPQFLGYRTKEGEVSDPRPWIGYPGTPICQNYAEGEQQHGYYLWDIKGRGDHSVDFFELVQPNPHVTIEWTGDLNDFKSKVTPCASGSRFRIRSSLYMSQEEIQAVSDVLKFRKDAREVVFKSDQTHDRDVFSAGGLEMMRDDLRNVDVQMLLLRDFYSASTIEDREWDDLSQHVTRYLQSAAEVDAPTRHTKWSINGMGFDNTFTYGKGNQIDFLKLKGIVGIFGPNRCGKSSIVGTLLYSLFNTTDRGSLKNLHVINSRKGFCETRTEINVDGVIYVVTRESSKNDTRKVTTAATSLDIERREPDGTMVSINGEQRSDTEKVLRKLIGYQEDFLLTSMSTQGDLTKFINEGSSFRKSILTKFLDLDVFERMHDSAKKDVNLVNMKLRPLLSVNWKEEQVKSKTKIDGYNEFLARADAKVESLRAELQALQVKLTLHQNVNIVTPEDVLKCKAEVERLVDLHEKCVKKDGEWKAKLVEADKKLESLVELQTSVDIQALRVAKSAERALEDSVTSLRHQFEKESTLVDQLKKSAKRLEVVPCGDQFPSCMFIKDSHIDKQKLPELLVELDKLAVTLKTAQISLAETKKQDLKGNIAKWDARNAEINEQKGIISEAKLTCERNNAALRDITARLNAEKKKLAELEQCLVVSEGTEVAKLRVAITTGQAQIKKFDQMRMEAASSRGKAQSELLKIEDQQIEKDRLARELRLYELAENAFSKRGIPTRIINSQLPAINSEIARILHGIVDFTIELEADEDSNSMEIYLNYGDSSRIIELGSGMEKMIAAIAIRVALLNVTSLPKTDMFILDEGFGALDEAGVEACNRLLVSLKKFFRIILVITHVDAVKDIADTVVEITRDGKDSKVCVQ